MFKLIAYNINTKLYSILDTSDKTICEVRLGCILNSLLYKGIDIKGIIRQNNYILIEKANLRLRLTKKSILGKHNIMNCGAEAYVIQDNGSLDILVEFTDGYTKSSTRQAFNKGNIANPNYDVKNPKLVRSNLGERKQMNCGKYCTVIAYRNSMDIDVQFDDGTVVKHRHKDNFIRGTIQYPIDRSLLGQTKRMNCGLEATVIRDSILEGNRHSTIDVKFEDNTILKNRTRQEFRKGTLSHKKIREALEKKKHIGQKKIMNNGLEAEIIAYRCFNDIDIKFNIDNFVKRHVSYGEFNRGALGHPQYTMHDRTSIIGQTNRMTCGMNATVIEDLRANNITVQFEDGTLVKQRSRGEFLRGNICHPNIGPKEYNSIVGQSRRMNNGLVFTVIEDKGVNWIKGTFEDGYVRVSTRTNFFIGNIGNPNILVNSMPELLTYKYIKTAFPDAIHNYRPDWLKNSNTKRNLEIDVWLPSLKVGIEYDGYAFHKERTETSDMKNQLIEQSDEITKLYILSEEGSYQYKTSKYEYINIYSTSAVPNFLYTYFSQALYKLLKTLGKERIPNLVKDTEFTELRKENNYANSAKSSISDISST